ncbi:hypothetical protein RM697_04595 [Ichthyenterobacterium sp. W332]|uniref:GNAT family N-acetyltransferase n=1 Tax=Microcosmobacter mediterraneus TaxID=3075607 RepID=A0ABU2YID4_9FLAO|nr:hypothetical protein [Ichthyenterobacterium sp. W332]MDT0557911.1 hypothetical protein [Ichthyenterobacterium sp. W332]
MSELTASFYTTIDDIESEHWNSLGCCDNIYYSPEFFKAFELAHNDIDFTYIIIFKGKEAVAFANTQIVTISIETITKNVKISDSIKRNINRFFNKNSPRILFCGNVFLSGEYGTFLKKGEDKIETFKAIADAVKELYKPNKTLNAVFVKDFKEESLYITNELKCFDYIPMRVEPNMIIHLKEEWSNFEDYKNALKSKYRVKANKADSTSKVLESKLFLPEDIEKYKNQMQALYENTISNSNFNAQVLNLNTYTHLKAFFGDKFIVKGYFYEGELVGYLSAMVNQDHLDAHFIGLDYGLNKACAIYPRILNDYVRLGIEHNSKRINLGRTASEIKSTLGAEPEDLMCYIRHRKTFQNQLMKPFIKNVKIKSFKQHHPFKT